MSTPSLNFMIKVELPGLEAAVMLAQGLAGRGLKFAPDEDQLESIAGLVPPGKCDDIAQVMRKIHEVNQRCMVTVFGVMTCRLTGEPADVACVIAEAEMSGKVLVSFNHQPTGWTRMVGPRQVMDVSRYLGLIMDVLAEREVEVREAQFWYDGD